jgi:hypothetical protein
LIRRSQTRHPAIGRTSTVQSFTLFDTAIGACAIKWGEGGVAGGHAHQPERRVDAEARGVAGQLGAGVAEGTDLEDTLRRQRLWGRVVITGPRVDVRSGSCADPAMRSMIEGKKPLLRGAGLTRLRCLEQSGAVVFERAL